MGKKNRKEIPVIQTKKSRHLQKFQRLEVLLVKKITFHNNVIPLQVLRKEKSAEENFRIGECIVGCNTL